MLQDPDTGGNTVGNIVLMMSVSADGFIEGPDLETRTFGNGVVLLHHRRA
jgi:hypothetical protein